MVNSNGKYMTEELNPVGKELASEGSAVETSSGQSLEATPVESVERVVEQSAETAGERLSETPTKPSLPPVASASADDIQVGIDAKTVYDETDAEARVTKLVSLAEVKGVEHAVRVARKLNDFYVLDRMHDELSGKFYDALKAKGMIAE